MRFCIETTVRMKFKYYHHIDASNSGNAYCKAIEEIEDDWVKVTEEGEFQFPIDIEVEQITEEEGVDSNGA